jgi:hypothetical protein
MHGSCDSSIALHPLIRPISFQVANENDSRKEKVHPIKLETPVPPLQQPTTDKYGGKLEERMPNSRSSDCAEIAEEKLRLQMDVHGAPQVHRD